MLRRACLLLLVVIAGTVAPSAAVASVVGVVPRACDETASKYMQCPDDLVVRGEGLENNALSVSVSVTGAPRTVRVRDEGAALRAGVGCAVADDGSVECAVVQTAAVAGDLRVDAGEGDDSVLVESGSWIVRGGPGDDTLTGSDTAGDILSGGPGADVLRGLGGDDALQDDERDGEATADQLDGGPGRDSVSYARRRNGVEVDLAAARGAEDRLSGIEDVSGGAGRDRLSGDAGPNLLVGGKGDSLRGRGGDDVFDGEDAVGPSRIEAGAGADLVRRGGSSRAGARVECGPGRDRVESPRPADVVALSCERAGRIRLGSGSIRDAGPGRGLILLLSTRRAGKLVVLGRARSAERGHAVRLTRAGLRLRRRAGRAAVSLELRSPRRRSAVVRFRILL